MNDAARFGAGAFNQASMYNAGQANTVNQNRFSNMLSAGAQQANLGAQQFGVGNTLLDRQAADGARVQQMNQALIDAARAQAGGYSASPLQGLDALLGGASGNYFVMNFQDESGLNPGINERNPIVPGSRGGFGLYQLTGPRRVAYERYARERGVPVSDEDAQLDFMMMELQGPEKRAAQAIFNTENAGDAAAAIVTNFLRPAEKHRAERVARYTSGSAPQTVSTRGREKMGLLGMMGGGREDTVQPPSQRERIGNALMSMSMFPTAGMQAQMQAFQQKKADYRDEQRDNRLLDRERQKSQNIARWLAEKPGGQMYAEAIAAGADVNSAVNGWMRTANAANDPMVQSANPLPGNAGTVFNMKDGAVKVVTVGGDELTGQEAVDYVNQANDEDVRRQREIYGARREGTLGANIELGGEAARVETEGGMSPKIAKEFGDNAAIVRSTLTNLDSAIQAIDEGAQSGAVYKMLPDITVASASLTNAMNRLGLDVIGSVTFGALSQAEMRLAMETAVPRNLGPEQLREWLTARRAAQAKSYVALIEAAQHFAQGGTQAEYYANIGANLNSAPPDPPTGIIRYDSNGNRIND